MNESKIFIKEILKQKGISYRQFSEMVGTTPANISSIANGKLQPRLETLEKWAKALGVSVSEILGNSQEEPNTITCPCCGAKFVLVKK